jgi:DHA2 family methylenomycin A resistance protein-like MFS transporter
MATPLGDERTYQRRWVILLTILISNWVGTLLNAMMPVALPSMLDNLDVRLSLGVWIISIYVLTFAVLNPLMGWLGDRFGFRRLYLLGVVGHFVTIFGAALAPTFGWLLFFRVLQGIASATVMPTLMGIMTQLFPKQERGLPMGVWAAVNSGGHGIGPAISGLLVQSFGWHSVFWFCGAMSLASFPLAFALVPTDNKSGTRKFDIGGVATLLASMVLFMFMLTQGGNLPLPLWARGALWALVPVFLLAFVYIESRTPEPFIELRLFSGRRYSALAIIIAAQNFCLFGLQVLMSLYLIQLRGLATGLAGLIIAPMASTLALSSPLGGRGADRLGFRTMIITGMSVAALGALSMTFWTSETPLWIVIVTLAVVGLGMGFTQSPTSAGVTMVVRQQEVGVAMGLFTMLRFLSGTLGTVIVVLLLDHARAIGGDPMQPFHTIFYVLTGAALLAVGLAVSIPRQLALAEGAAD